MKIAYVLPSFMCCGGNRIAIEHCNRLAQREHEVLLTAVQPELYELDWINLSKNVRVVEFGQLAAEKPDAITATYFKTVYDIESLRLPEKTRKFYLVQQIESRFFRDEHSKLFAEMTYYKKDFEIITISSWLKNEFQVKYNKKVHYVPNKQELPKIQKAKVERITKGPVLLIEGDIRSLNKGVYDALLATTNLPYETWLLTNAQSVDLQPAFHFCFHQRFFAKPWEEALNIIRSADILIKPSKFEGSPTPHMEAMELGTAVITSDCTGVDEYCVPEWNCLQYPIDNTSALRQAIQRLAHDVELRKKLVKNGKKFAKDNFDWKDSIDKLEKIYANRKV